MLAIGDEGPGIEKTFIFSTEHSCTRSDPGSEIIGVPESEINASERPDFIFLIIEGIIFFELNL